MNLKRLKKFNEYTLLNEGVKSFVYDEDYIKEFNPIENQKYFLFEFKKSEEEELKKVTTNIIPTFKTLNMDGSLSKGVKYILKEGLTIVYLIDKIEKEAYQLHLKDGEVVEGFNFSGKPLIESKLKRLNEEIKKMI